MRSILPTGRQSHTRISFRSLSPVDKLRSRLLFYSRSIVLEFSLVLGSKYKGPKVLVLTAVLILLSYFLPTVFAETMTQLSNSEEQGPLFEIVGTTVVRKPETKALLFVISANPDDTSKTLEEVELVEKVNGRQIKNKKVGKKIKLLGKA